VATGPLYYLDTNVLIAAVEGTGRISDSQLKFFADIDTGTIKALTSELSLAECLVKPFADKNADLIEAFLLFLDGRPNFPLVPVIREVLVEAARLRSEMNLRLPDAIHIATAQMTGSTVFMTNDRGIKVPSGMRVQLWDELALP
jgi:predicted nucleic acid-binding protein